MLVEQSAWDKFPTDENPNALYKFTSIHFSLHHDIVKYNRETYGALDVAGDIGGLIDFLRIVGYIIVNPFASYALDSLLSSKIVRYNAS